MGRRSGFFVGLLIILMMVGAACSLDQRLASLVKEPTPTRSRRLVVFPAVLPTPVPPTSMASFDTALVHLAEPGFLPTLGARPQPFESPLEALSSFSVSPTATPVPVDLPTPVTPMATAPPTPSYDFLLAEFFNSPTTNSFLMVYVAIVDPQEIPIGDMKIVGTRLDHNLTYESPLSKWHYEGYSAPGEVIKSGNTKFEPPGGIETTDWVLHLEDAHGNRQSEDIPFHVDTDNKQWYFIKLRRIF